MPFLNDSFALPKAFLFWMFIPLFLIHGRLRPDKDEYPLYFLTALFFILSVFSIYPALSFKGLYRYYFNGFFALFAGFALFRFLRMCSARIFKKHLAALLFSILLSCSAVFGFSGGRISSTFGNPNFFGAVLASASPYALYLALSKPFYMLHFIFFVIALLMTSSRASWLGFTAGLIFFICAVWKNRLIAARRLRLVRALFAAAALVLVSVLIISPRFAENLGRRAASIFDMSDSEIISRFEGYAASLSIFSEKALFGRGPESFSILFRAHAPLSFIRQTGGLAHAGYSHSWPLQLLTETGIAGFGAWLFLLFILFSKARASEDIFKKAAAASICAYCVTNIFAFPSITDLMIFWFSAAVIYGPRAGPPESVNIFSRSLRLAAATAALLLLSAPLLSEIFFAAASISADKGKAYRQFRRAALFMPADHHLMNAGKSCMIVYDETRLPLWIERAEYFFEKLVRKNPRHALALNGLGAAAREKFIIRKEAQYAAAAEDFFKRSIDNDPYLRASRVNLALLLEEQGRLEEALSRYGEALEIYGDDQQILFNSGVVSIKDGNPLKALEFWLRLRELNPGYSRLEEYIDRARALKPPPVDGGAK